MEIYHVSDLHIGRDFNGYDLTSDQAYTLNAITNMVRENKIKYLILAGDIFDKYNPSNEATALFEDFITNLSKLNIRIIIISGNHDSKARLGYLSGFLRKDNIYIYTEIPKDPILFDEDKLAFMPIPYLHDFELKSRYKDMNLEPNGIYEALINDFHSKVPKGYTKICICHNLVIGGEVSSSERTISVGGVDEMDRSLFKDFDYTALGHLHICQKMGHNIYYSGSIMKYSTSEFKNVNSLLSFNTDTKNVERIPLPQIRGARILHDTFNNIMANAPTDPNKDDFIGVELTDEGIVYNAFSRISEYYTHVVSLSMMNRKRDINNNTPELQVKNDSPLDIFNEFYSYITKEEPTKRELDCFKEAMDECEVGE